MYTRRIFVKNSALALAGASLFSKSIFTIWDSEAIIGVQLYSVRDDMKTDPKGSLKKLADMGYKVVEHAGYNKGKFYGFTPTEFKQILDDLGLKMYSGHVNFGMMSWDNSKNGWTDDWRQTVEDAAAVGQQFVITPELADDAQKDYDKLMKVIELWNKCGELCQKHGMKFGYHDDFNQDNTLHGMSLYDIVMKNCDPKLTIQQFDIANLYNAAGTDPLDILNKYPGRFTSLHVKDVLKEKNARNDHDSTILGKGVLNVKKVLEVARQKGAWLMIIEQESYQDKTPLDCVKEDLQIVKTWGY
ncbi:MAG: sugar phosphate isomerase/epimerase family protein [Chitinophagales bacterium]